MARAGEYFLRYVAALQSSYDAGEATAIARMVFEDVLGWDATHLILHDKDLLKPQKQEQLELILQRLNKHEPVQYVLGYTYFFDCKLKVNPHVLIPRPETEELVEWIISENKSPQSILDIGTGSGCIAIALKKKFPSAQVYATDISNKALTVAKENTEQNKTPVHFIQDDILNSHVTLRQAQDDMLPAQFEIIISNPPYIPASEKHSLNKNVLDFEPHDALFTPTAQPLLYYDAILHFSKSNLQKGGRLYVEVHELYANETKQLFERAGFQTAIRNDLHEKPRMLRGQKAD